MKAARQFSLALSTTMTRRRLRGVANTGTGETASYVCVRAIDRDSFVVVCGQRVEADGTYSLQVPAYYSGVRKLMLIATYPTDQYNAVVADRVMPETVIE